VNARAHIFTKTHRNPPHAAEAWNGTNENKSGITLGSPYQGNIARVRIGRKRFSVGVIAVLNNNNQTHVGCRVIDRMSVTDDNHRGTLKPPQEVEIAGRPRQVTVRFDQSGAREMIRQGSAIVLNVTPIRHNNHDRLPPGKHAMGQARYNLGGTRAWCACGPRGHTQAWRQNGASTRPGHGVKSGLWETWNF
jgi:hypothetical protein